jgi:hypothetical protein
LGKTDQRKYGIKLKMARDTVDESHKNLAKLQRLRSLKVHSLDPNRLGDESVRILFSNQEISKFKHFPDGISLMQNGMH